MQQFKFSTLNTCIPGLRICTEQNFRRR